MSSIPMLGSLGSLVLVATMGNPTAGGQARSLLAAGMFLVATLGMLVVQLDRQRSHRAHIITVARTEYLHYLGTVRTTIRAAAAQQRAALLRRHPDPSALPALAAERSRVWERGSERAGFLHVRYGVCSQPSSLELAPPEPRPVDQVDPAAAFGLHRFLAVHRVQPNLPATLDLRAFDRIEICGGASQARSLARAMICSAAAFQSPEHLAVAVLASEGSLARWDWTKWLPHSLSARACDAVGPRRMVSTRLEDLAALLPPGLADRPRLGADLPPPEPHVLLVVDGAAGPADDLLIPADGRRNMTVLHLLSLRDEPEGRRLRLVFDEGPHPEGVGPEISVLRPRQAPARAVADQCDLATAEAFARRLAPLSGATSGIEALGKGGAIRGDAGFTDLLGVGDVRRYDPAPAWLPRPPQDRLRVPIGLDGDGSPVHLDLKESAQHGMGPHGLVVGATGSGKSELLRTLVLGLALTHSPEELNLVLVDFKGGATFAGMSGMPHVSALITNLARELTLVDRMQDALSGELVRRQELLRAAGNYASVHEYERARAAGQDLVPVPSLLVVVDEFSELLTAKPEFLDLFVAIGRLGRSLGLHLLLASQRLEEGRLRGLESHLSYRIGLRTFSALESRAVLGVPDAYELPPVPGLGLLKADVSTLLRFTASYVSGPLPGASDRPPDEAGTPGILPWTTLEVQVHPPSTPMAPPDPAPRHSSSTGPESLLEVAVGRMGGHGPAAHQVWLPPLEVPDTLGRLMPDLRPDPDLGLVSHEWRALGGLTVPLGTVDRPREQRRDTLTVDLAGASGHVAVVGGPRSGKSTLLRTLVSSLSLTTTPLESQFFVLDFGGGAFDALRALPHVAGIATRSEPDVVRRIVAEVTGIVDRREACFRAERIDSIEAYRTRRAQGRVDDGYGDVFLVVDGWSTLRAEFDDLELELQQLAARGLTFGFHVLTTSSRWADYRATVRDLMGTRLELRLGDPLDSEMDRRLAALVPPDRPGRGILPGRLHFLAALPRLDDVPDGGTLAAGVESMVEQISQAWPGPSGPKLRVLPELLAVDDLLAQAEQAAVSGPHLLLGVSEKDLAPVGLDPVTEPHWLVFGDNRSGKSAALRRYVDEVMRTHTPKQAQIVLVDYRRSLLGDVPEEYLLGYLTSAAQATPMLADLASYLEGRIPGPDVTPEQLRRRSWWSGAEVFVVVDDYDLVATTQSSPVQVLQPLLAQGRDVGLHLALARRSGGASRALYEPVIQSLRDLAVPGLVLSGNADEGALVGGVRPAPAPAGRGRFVTRDGGVEVIQLAWRAGSL
jgi:S-DNA-T family DNA segregation ATPase FtsK/SpoIIIE